MCFPPSPPAIRLPNPSHHPPVLSLASFRDNCSLLPCSVPTATPSTVSRTCLLTGIFFRHRVGNSRSSKPPLSTSPIQTYERPSLSNQASGPSYSAPTVRPCSFSPSRSIGYTGCLVFFFGGAA